MRNPTWTTDELILGLDVYRRLVTSELVFDNAEIISLSKLLRVLPIHPADFRNSNFRNPTGVAMELRTFLRLDPEYAGKGLERGSQLSEDVWREFAFDHEKLVHTATAIRNAYKELGAATKSGTAWGIDERCGDEAFAEGAILRSVHLLRERNPRAVRAKKEHTLGESGRLACEVCAFDFSEVYGELGEGFIECHHLKPLADLVGERKTRLCDLALVCSNCHRMLHRSRRWLAIEELQGMLTPRAFMSVTQET